MPALALFDALQDFGKRTQPAHVAPMPIPAAPPPDVEREPPIDVEAIVRAAVEEAQATIERRMLQAQEAALDAERQRHAEEMEAMLQHFGQESGAIIAARIDEMESRIGDLSSAAIARILGSVLSDDLLGRSMDSLAQTIRTASSDRETVRIQVRGPQSLFESLQAALGPHAAGVDYIESPGLDLIVSIDENLFETRLSEWSSRLSDILS